MTSIFVPCKASLHADEVDEDFPAQNRVNGMLRVDLFPILIRFEYQMVSEFFTAIPVEDKAAMITVERVFQLLQGPHYAQVPPSRTVHFISNVEVEEGTASGEVTPRCNVIVYELRPGDHQALQVDLGRQRAIIGRCEYRLRYDLGQWAIKLKKVVLIDRDLPLHNLTFIL